MSIRAINVMTEVAALKQPFVIVPLVRMNDFAFMIFKCHGAVDWHKHEDFDEMFFVQQGQITLETEAGPLELHPCELAVVPRHLLHRIWSHDLASVVLFERTSRSQERNGHRKIFRIKQEPAPRRVDVCAVHDTLREPFAPMTIAQVNDCVVTLQLAHGQHEWEAHPDHDELIFVHEGAMGLEIGAERVEISSHDMVLIPYSQHYRITASEQAVFLRFAHLAGS